MEMKRLCLSHKLLKKSKKAEEMAKSDVDKVTDETISKGGILVKLYFDMQNEEKDKLQPLMVDLINERLMKERGVVYCYGAIEEPIESHGVFVTSAVVTMLFDNFFPLVNIAFNYSPAGVEILKPEKGMTFKASELQSMLMDLSQVSITYSKYILEKVMNQDDVQKIRQQLDNRASLGKKLLEEKKTKKEDQ